MTRKPLPLTPNAPHEWCEPSAIFSYVFLLNNENEMVFLCPMLAESLKSLKDADTKTRTRPKLNIH